MGRRPDRLGAQRDLRTKRLVERVPRASGADIFTQITKAPSKGKALTTACCGPLLDVEDTHRPKLLQRLRTAPSCVSKTCRPSYSGKTGPESVGSHEVVFDPGQTHAHVSDLPGGTLSVIDLTRPTARLIANIRTSYGAFGFPDGVAYVSFQDGLARTSGD